MIKVKLSNIFVDNQERALEFYTKILGLKKKTEEPAGDYKWLTVGNSDSEFEMLLEPNVHPAAKAYQKSIYDDGIPAAMLFVDNIDTEYKRLKNANVEFKFEPMTMGKARIAILNDTCGNWISLCQLL